MDGWIKENKAYLAAVGGIAAGTLAIYVFLVSPISAGAEKELKSRQAAEMKYRAAASGGVPEEPAVVQAEADAKAQAQKLDEMVRQLQLVLAEKFTSKGKSGTYVEHFNMIKLEVRDEWQNLNSSGNLGDFPSPEKLNFTSWTPESEDIARDALVRLGVADTALRVILDSLESGEKIEALDILYQSQHAESDDLFLRRIPIQVRVTASSKSIFRSTSTRGSPRRATAPAVRRSGCRGASSASTRSRSRGRRRRGRTASRRISSSRACGSIRRSRWSRRRKTTR
jgi:hypothetical protein